jgi:hypothetical protein
MPMSLLLVDKVVREETQDVLVQKPLRSLNEHHPPTLISGPHLTYDSLLNKNLSDLIFGAASGDVDRKGRKYDHRLISKKLASWYNKCLSIKPVHFHEMHYSQTEKQHEERRLPNTSATHIDPR